MKRIILLSLAAASVASGQSIKPRPLGAVQATSKELLGNPTLARALPNGSVIVNDVARRRLLLLDPSLQDYTVIADSTSGATNGYGPRPGALIPYVGDSTLFLDPAAGSFIVIDPAGKATRVMSPPRPNDNGQISNFNNGFPGFDAKGRMVYRTNYPVVPFQTRDGNIQMPPRPDSAPLLRVDLDTRRADTIAAIRTPRMISNSITLPNGGVSTMMMQAPLSTIDDWAVLSDGTIAVVRGRDYRIDFIQPDGSKRVTEKMAFDWKRLSDDDKLALIDSIQKSRAAGPAGGGGPQVMFGGGQTIVMGGGGRGDMVGMERMAVGAMAASAASIPAPSPVTGAAPPASSTTTAQGAASASSSTSASGAQPAGASNAASSATAAGGPAANPMMPTIPAPAIADMPDYMPAFTQTSARADADANLWIRTTTPGAQPGNVVYDVISSQGMLVDRVDVPKGMQIVGFAKGGIVYLSQREGYQYRVLKASIK
jgi:hypothetical protein